MSHVISTDVCQEVADTCHLLAEINILAPTQPSLDTSPVGHGKGRVEAPHRSLAEVEF